MSGNVTGKPADVQALLNESYAFADRRAWEQALEKIRPLQMLQPLEDPRDQSTYCRLLVRISFGLKRYAETEETALGGLTTDTDDPDLLFFLCLSRVALREYRKALEAGEKYLAVKDRSVESGSPGTFFSSSNPNLAQLLDRMGEACRQLDDSDQAEDYFKKAINADPADHRAYLNLAGLYQRSERTDLAAHTVEAGLKACRQVQELRILKAAFRKRQTISACLMVKNEEELLGNCLKSVRDWVDEIIVIDTGSTDKTVEIAQSFGARVFHQPWEGSFSKHRNYSMEQATSDWLLIIDADEEMYEEDIPDLLPFLEDPRVKAVSLNVLNVYGTNEQKQVFLVSPRLFRRELNARYDGIVHNQVRLPDDTPVVRTPARLKHFGYDLSPEKMEEKLQRSRQLLEKQLKQDPNNAFAMFNLAQILRAGSDECPHERGPEILRLAGRAVELTGPDKLGERHIHLMCLDQMAWTCFYLKDFDRALKYCYQALQHKADYLDPLLLIGHVYMGREEHDEAVRHYETYLDAQAAYDPDRETDEIILQHIDSRTTVYCNLGLVAYARERFDEAYEWLQKCVELDPDFPGASGWLGRVCLQQDNESEAERHLLKHVEAGERVSDEPLLLANLYLKRADTTHAEVFLRQAQEIDDSDISVVLKLGRLYAETGREDDAKQAFETAIQMVGSGPDPNRHLAETFQRLGRHTEAESVLKRLIESGKGNPQIYNDLGNICYQSGDFVEAEKQYREALAFELAPVEAYRNLGLTLARLERPGEAIEPLSRYLSTNPDDTAVWRIIGDIHSMLGEHDSALESYERVLAASPDDKMTIFNLSECYLHMGHTDSAILGYQRVLQMDRDFDLARQRLVRLTEQVERT